MEPLVVLLASIALAVASLLWGADSREDGSRDRPRRWFINLY